MNVERSVVSPWAKGGGKKNRGGAESRVGWEATKKNGGQPRRREGGKEGNDDEARRVYTTGAKGKKYKGTERMKV